MMGHIPEVDTIEYVLEAPPTPPEEEVDDDIEGEKKRAKSSSASGGLILFAIDISSSMECTIDIPELQGRKEVVYCIYVFYN